MAKIKKISLENSCIIQLSKMQKLKKRCAVSIVYISTLFHDMQKDGVVEMPKTSAFQEVTNMLLLPTMKNDIFTYQTVYIFYVCLDRYL